MTERGSHLRVHLAIALALAIALSLLAPGPSVALDALVDDRGQCSGPSHWRLDVRRPSPSVLSVKFQVEGGKADQRWNVFLSDNGTLIFSGRRISGPNGHFEVRVRTANRRGEDTISAAANNKNTGERCSGKVTI